MAGIEVKVDATKALAKFSPAGIPEAVRRNLRSLLPDLTKQLGALVDSKLDAGLKSRRRLETKKEIVESPTAIYGHVRVIATSDPRLLPQWLESGTKAHVIEARNAQALSFFWPRVGKNVMFKRVMHPGFAGIHYMENAFTEMRGEIVARLNNAVRTGVREMGNR